jgi:bifunctional DNase/RNase
MSDEREERPEEPENLDQPPAFFPYDETEETREESVDFGEPVEVRVEGVYVAQNGKDIHRFVLLTDDERKLPIQIGGAETTAITLPIEGHKTDRPMTHDLFVAVLERLGAVVVRVVIDDLWGTTYYAKLYLLIDDEEIEVDCRPSDAIALAVRVGAQILVADGILQQASEGWPE